MMPRPPANKSDELLSAEPAPAPPKAVSADDVPHERADCKVVITKTIVNKEGTIIFEPSPQRGPPFRRGAEKSVFKFGGSAVVLFGERGAWLPADDILQHTSEGMETYLRLGDVFAQRI
jgi:hypothetical protein